VVLISLSNLVSCIGSFELGFAGKSSEARLVTLRYAYA